MADEYQFGTDAEWQEHANLEMAKTLKQRNRQLGCWRFFALLMLLAALCFGGLLFLIARHHSIADLIK